MQDYFEVRSHLQGPNGRQIRAGIFSECARVYRGRKYRFKKKWWDERGGDAKELINMPPPDVEEEDWHKFVELVTGESFRSRSAANKGCRSKQTITVHQGRKSFAQNRYANVSCFISKVYSFDIDLYKTLIVS